MPHPHQHRDIKVKPKANIQTILNTDNIARNAYIRSKPIKPEILNKKIRFWTGYELAVYVV